MTTTSAVIAGLATVTAFCALLGAVFRTFGQPAVLGHITAGILLGPSCLGQLSMVRAVFSPDAVSVLSAIAQVALVLYLFATAYTLDLAMLKGRRKAVLATTLGSLLPSLAAGTGLGLVLHGFGSGFAPVGVDVASFALYLGIALSITAVPVLASIIQERALDVSPIGVVSLTSAALVDVVGWFALAAVVAGTASSPPLLTLAVFAGHVVLLLLVVRPLLRRWYRRPAVSGGHRVAAVVTLAFASAWVTEMLGLHVIFGALLSGLAVPRRDGRPDDKLLAPIDHAGKLLLPTFFAISGLSVDLTKLSMSDVGTLAVVFVVAIAAKLGGTTLVSRWSGLTWRESAVAGALMNTRGLTELVVLSVGLSSGIIGVPLYSMLVLMAIAATAMTAPLLTLWRADLLLPTRVTHPSSSRLDSR